MELEGAGTGNSNKEETRLQDDQHRRFKLVLALLALIIAGIGGIKTGNWLINRQIYFDKMHRIDEYVGLGERTGMTGELSLQVDPISLSVRSGDPVRVKLTLTNRTSETMMLNGWLAPTPADMGSNQLPLKVVIYQSGKRISHRGAGVLFPPHGKKDFFALRPGQSKEIETDLSRLAGGGRWDLSVPGTYLFEAWYETYITGRYVGIRAWTGMTNHVVVQVTVNPG